MKERLRLDIVEGLIQPSWKPEKAKMLRIEYQEMKGLFASRLAAMRKAVQDGTAKPPPEPKERRWDDNNPVREQLKKDIISEAIPDTMDEETAWKTRTIYKNMLFARWKSRLEGMREIVKKKRHQAAEDAMDLMSDRLVYPKMDFDLMGKPQWEESEAQICLEFDLDEGLHEQMKPEELWNMREQYQVFALDVFRGHMYQELHTRKWRAQWVDGKKEYALVPEPRGP